ncbi:autotransporter domain-containing protein [uncultured Phascolarctobacterium sp.]|uniref:autotransporter domain-containing protein n=1 Tax=uncultured Phascolarctobacterium sp. TaxID=512296 RepID=UPI002624169E|nr:autotransporter domain-containing protein [uncultured Phascolarctobacterium sp.]
MMKKRESILSKRILAGLMLGLLLGSSFYAQPAVAGEVINVVTQEAYEKVKDSNGYVKPQQSLTDNIVTIGTDVGGNSPSIGSSGYSYVYGGYAAGTEAAKNNKVFIKSGVMEYVYGGRSASGAVTGNSVIISGGTVNNAVGGYTYEDGVIMHNSVNISGGTAKKTVYGGYTLRDGVIMHNSVNISGGTVYAVYGGSTYGDGVVMHNSVNISGGTIEQSAFGGWGWSSNTKEVVGNSIIISSDAIINGYVCGGKNGTGIVAYNSVVVNGGKIARDILGGESNNGGTATYNSATVSAGLIQEDIYGGKSDIGAVEYNSAVISGGTIKGNIYGGYSGSGAVTGNSVNISGTPAFGENTVLYGGLSTNGTVSGNTLNFNSKGLTLSKVQNFDAYNFCLPGGTRADATLLTMTADNGADISGSKVQVSAEGTAAAFKAGDQITLLYTDTPGTGSVIKADNMDYGKEMRQGVSVVYDITTGLNEDGHKLVTTIDGGKVLEQTKSPVETQAATAAFLNSGADLLVGGGIASMTAVTSAEDGAIFGTMGGGSMRYKTGSYADVKGYNLAMGFGKAVTNNAGKLTFGPFIEYGKGEYTSHLDDGIRGDGNTKYYGVGVLARQDNNSGVYYEGSLRYGRRNADYASGDMIGALSSKVASSYDSSSAYYGVHLGIGKVNKLNDTTKADVYAKFMYTHQNGDSVALRGEGNGEVYDFDAVDSTRVRVGARVSKAYSERGTGYAGLAYEYEFDGEAKATVLGFSTPSPSIKGSSGLLELGYILQPKGANDPAIDINLQGWGGKKQGFTGNVNFVWKF